MLTYNNIALFLASVLLALVTVAIIRRIVKDMDYAQSVRNIHIVFCTLIGWSLVVASAIFNLTYTYKLISGMQEFESFARAASIFAVAVNLAGGIALHAMAVSALRKQHLRAVIFFCGYVPILCYSLLAANSILLTGDFAVRQGVIAALAEQEAASARITALSAANKAITSTSGVTMSADIPTTVANANGTRVSMRTYCTPGSWYAKNRTDCQAYLAAISNSRAAAAVATNISRIADEKERIAASKANAPIPLQSIFFGLEVPPKVATLALSVAMEIAAGVVLLYVAWELRAFHTPLSSQNGGSQSAQTTGSAGSGLRPGNSGSGRVSSNGAGGGQVKPDSDQSEHQRSPVALDGVESAYKKVFANNRTGAVSDVELEDLMYQLALANPHARATSTDIIDTLKHYRGTGVGKSRILKLMQSPAMADVILVQDNDGSKSFIYRDLTHANNTRNSPGTGGLPSGRSLAGSGSHQGTQSGAGAA